MTSSPASQIVPQPHEVVAFWRNAGPQQWFSKSADFDAAFRTRFEAAHMAAAARQLDAWLDDATGALALMVLLDQFPRNAYRDTAHMFATDPLAQYFADRAIAAGHDLGVDPQLRQFFYLLRARGEPCRAKPRGGFDGDIGRRLAALGGPASRHRQALWALSPSQRRAGAANHPGRAGISGFRRVRRIGGCRAAGGFGRLPGGRYPHVSARSKLKIPGPSGGPNPSPGLLPRRFGGALEFADV